MANQIKIFAFLFLSLCAHACISETSSFPEEEEGIKFGVTFNSMPWISNDAANPKGVLIDIINTTFAELNIKTDYRMMPHARVLNMLSIGTIDAGVVLYPAEKKISSSQACSAPLLKIPAGLYLEESHFKRLGKIPWNDLIIGHIRISNAGVPPEVSELDIHSFGDSTLLFKSFKAKRINAVLSSPLVVEHLSGVHGLQVVPVFHIAYIHLFVCFSKKNIGEEAYRLAERTSEVYFSLLEDDVPLLSPEAKQVSKLYDPRLEGTPVTEVSLPSILKYRRLKH